MYSLQLTGGLSEPLGGVIFVMRVAAVRLRVEVEFRLTWSLFFVVKITAVLNRREISWGAVKGKASELETQYFGDEVSLPIE
ncbi:MAG: hypothetical protein M3Z09_01760 [Acidobacteriota bacterium]|nr:hypothetical protein [Acidobacteriota bacterium]